MFIDVEVLEENRYQIDQQLIIAVLNKRGHEVIKLFLYILLFYKFWIIILLEVFILSNVEVRVIKESLINNCYGFVSISNFKFVIENIVDFRTFAE